MYEDNLVSLMSKIVYTNPVTFNKVSHGMQRVNTMHEEYGNIVKNDVWDLVQPLPKGTKVIGSRWIFKLKHNQHNPNASIEKCKGIFATKGLSYKWDIDYDGIFPSHILYIIP